MTVASTTLVPTGAMVRGATAARPTPVPLLAALREPTKPARSSEVDTLAAGHRAVRRRDRGQPDARRRRLPGRRAAAVGRVHRAGHRAERRRGGRNQAAFRGAGSRSPIPTRSRPRTAGPAVPTQATWQRAGRAGGGDAQAGGHPGGAARRLPGRAHRAPLRQRPADGVAGRARRRRRTPHSPRRSPAACTSSPPTRTSTRWPGCSPTPRSRRGSPPRFPAARTRATGCTRRRSRRSAGSARSRSARGCARSCRRWRAGRRCAAHRWTRSVARRCGSWNGRCATSTGRWCCGWPPSCPRRRMRRPSPPRRPPTSCGATRTSSSRGCAATERGWPSSASRPRARKPAL